MLPTTGFVKTKRQASFLLDTCISFFDIPTRCHKWHRGQHSLLKRASAYKPLTDVNIHHVLAIHVRIHFLSCVLFFTFLPWDENRHRALSFSLNMLPTSRLVKTKRQRYTFCVYATFPFFTYRLDAYLITWGKHRGQHSLINFRRTFHRVVLGLFCRLSTLRMSFLYLKFLLA